MSGEFSPEVYEIVRERSTGVCEVCGDAVVWDLHHRHPRKAGGTKRSWIGLPSNCLGVCRDDHNLIESRRRLAYRLGWLVEADHDPSQQRVLYRGEYVFLTDDGLRIPQEAA